MEKNTKRKPGKSSAIFHEDFLIEAINKKNLTFNSFATNLDVSGRTISSACKGKRVSLALAQKMIEQLELPQGSLKYASTKKVKNLGFNRLFDFGGLHISRIPDS